jgi:hypothetical protein
MLSQNLIQFYPFFVLFTDQGFELEIFGEMEKMMFLNSIWLEIKFFVVELWINQMFIQITLLFTVNKNISWKMTHDTYKKSSFRGFEKP